MSHSEEEDHLSIPTEESVEDVAQDQDEEEETENEPPPLVKFAPAPAPQSRQTNMTLSNSSDHNVISEEPKMPRRFVKINEENVILKKQLKKQEERIKILATKLIRVISDRSNKAKREEILLEEQKARITDLEHEVSNLRDKLQVSKQQLTSYTKLIPHHPLPLHQHHGHPPSRQASMLSSSTATTSHSKLKKPLSARSSAAAVGSQPPRPGSTSRSNFLIDKNFADRVEELLLEAKAENQALEDQLKHCRQRLASTEEELEKMKGDLQGKEAEHQEEILSIKTQLGKEQDMAKKKKQLSDNIQLIRLQRESRRTASWLSTLEAQCLALESRLGASTETVGQLESQLAEAQEELAQEQQKNITFQKQAEDATSSLNRLKELEAQITSLQEENDILKDTNASLLKKAFSVPEKAEKAESASASAESAVKVQKILETVLKAEIKSKTDLQESLQAEKEKCIRLEIENESLQDTIQKIAGGRRLPPPVVSETELSERLLKSSTSLISLRDCDQSCPHVPEVDELKEALDSVTTQLTTLKDEHAKTKSLFKAQLTANAEYQKEVDTLRKKLDQADEFHHKKLQDFVQVLEERTRQLTHLEKFVDEWKDNQLGEKESCTICGNCIKGDNDGAGADSAEIGGGGDSFTKNVEAGDTAEVILIDDDEDVHEQSDTETPSINH